MNNLFVIQNDFAPALLSALMHSIWTGGVLYLALRAYMDNMTRHNSSLRYMVAVLALVTQAMLTVVLFVAIYESGPQAGVFNETISFQGKHAPGLPGSTGSVGNSGFMHVSEITLLVYLAGVVFFSFRLLILSVLIKKRINLGSVASLQYTKLLEQTRSRLGIIRCPRLIMSDHLQSPALYGFFKPVIIVPTGMFTHLTFEQVEVILLHELMHLKKADFLVNLFLQLVESLLFFNPFTWLISRIIREEREMRIDDAVTEHCHPATYARALFNLSVLQIPRSAASLAAAGGGQKLLLNRIQRILKTNHMKKAIKTRIYLTAIVATGTILLISLSGFSSSLLQIDRQQTKAAEPALVHEAGDMSANSGQELHAVTGPGVYSTAAINVNTYEVQSAAVLNTERNPDVHMGTFDPGQDTLTEKERKELLEQLERARYELRSIDWEKEIARIEKERVRMMEELPARMEQEQRRIQKELSRIDEEVIRKEMERAHVHLDSVRHHFDREKMQQQLQQNLEQMEMQRNQLEAQIRNGEFPDEDTRKAMERSLESLRTIDYEKMMANIEEAMMDLEMNMDFDLAYDFEINIDHDSLMLEAQKSLQEIDIEGIKEGIDRSVREIELRIEALKSSDIGKNDKK